MAFTCDYAHFQPWLDIRNKLPTDMVYFVNINIDKKLSL